MIYKKSRYVVPLDEQIYTNVDGKQVFPIFNTNTGAFGAMNKETNAIYSSGDVFDESKITDEYVKTQISVLAQNGFLVDDSIDELEKLKFIDRSCRYDNSSLSLTIAPTLACNMDCSYCFEQKNGHVMKENVQDAIIDYIRNKAKTISHLFITWYGGEPLLEVGIIKKLSIAIVKICEENNIQYSANMITNGYCLTDEVASILKEDCKLSVAQITIDGCSEVHNKRRHLKNGNPSFDIIVKNIENAKKHFFVSVRCNVDRDNILEAKKLIDYLFMDRLWSEEKNISIHFSPVRGNHDDVNCFSSANFSEIHNDLMEHLYNVGAFSSVVGTIPKPISHACGAVATNSVVIDPDGDLYKCYEIIGQKKYVVGNIFDGEYLSDKLLKWLMLDMSPECEDCVFLPMCQSACPLKRLEKNSKNCYHNSLTYAKALNIAYRVHMRK